MAEQSSPPLRDKWQHWPPDPERYGAFVLTPERAAHLADGGVLVLEIGGMTAFVVGAPAQSTEGTSNG